MINLVCFRKKLEQWCHSLLTKLPCFLQPCRDSVWSSIHVLVCRVNPFWIQLFYFIIISSLGYLALIMFDTRKPWPAAAASSSTSTSSNTPKDFDVFFTSVSAATVSSMSTVEMEVFSNSQLVILTILMLFGGEIFTSMLGLVFIRYSNNLTNTRIDSVNMDLSLNNNHHHLSIMSIDSDNHSNLEDKIIEIYSSNMGTSTSDHNKLKYNSIKYLVYVVLGYHLMVHICGSSLVYMYFSIVSTSARQVLEKKGIHRLTFSIFTIVSTISNCGFVPTNENMMVFKANSGLLWILIPQILVGNTLFPTCLRVVIWVLERITKRVEFSYMLNNTREMEYSHLLSTFYSTCLAFTVLGFVALQFMLFCSMEWNNSEAMYGFNSNYHKLVASLFQVVNSRHTGESVVDLSIISPAILVLFVVMMYLPPYMSFVPTTTYTYKVEEEEEEKDGKKERKTKPHPLVKCLIFSHLSYLVIFIFLICITERQNIKEDPLNFNVLNIVFEVISAYGNVGFSTGYSCERRIISDYCENKMYGFVGRWTNKGKLILIIVMFFGRLKKFNMKGGSSWKLL